MKTQQDIIAALSEIISENTVYETTAGIRVNHRFYIYGLFVANEELEVMDVHGTWRKLVMNEGSWTTVELNAKDNWQEVDDKWADEREIFRALENYFELTPVLRQAA